METQQFICFHDFYTKNIQNHRISSDGFELHSWRCKPYFDFAAVANPFSPLSAHALGS